jgi:DNA-binding NarL/FixJ family response regulator
MTEPSTAIRVLVADDQQVMREGLVALLGLVDEVDVIGAVGDGEQAVRAAGDLSPDVVLIDLRMPVLDGVAATRRITQENPGPTVKTHINNVFAEIGARNRADAVRCTYRHGLAQP